MSEKSPFAAGNAAPRLLQYFPPRAINRCTPGLLDPLMHSFSAEKLEEIDLTECLGPGAMLPAWQPGDLEPG